MHVAIGIWSRKINPGESLEFEPATDLLLTNATLGPELPDPKGRTSVRLVYGAPTASESDDEDDASDDNSPAIEPVGTILCSLTPGYVEHAKLNLILEGEAPVLFEVVGKNPVYLTGNYIDQGGPDEPPSDDEVGFPEGGSDLEEDGYRLEDVSSDVEANPDELDGLEVDELDEDDDDAAEAAASKKRSRGSDVGSIDTEKLSKTDRKLLKKLKAENGQAVPTATETKAELSEKEPSKKESKKEKKDKKEKDKASAGPDTKSKVGQTQEITGGVKIKDVTAGKGRAAQKGDTVKMRYIGKLENGKVFDSNTKGSAFKFTLGDGDVIKGWDVGIVGMQEGGERLLTIPPQMGYGKRKQADIPANSTLIFEVKLLKVL